MAGGGMIQLVAFGPQDGNLTSNPDTTFFKAGYERYSAFALESIEQSMNGTSDFGKKTTTTVSRSGDLMYKTYLQVQLPSLVNADGSTCFGTPAQMATTFGTNQNINICWTNALGHALIRYCEIEIGNTVYDRHYGLWLDLWDEISNTADKIDGYGQMVGKFGSDLALIGNANDSKILYVPLQFWFCRNSGLAIPLLALGFHEVRLIIELRSAQELVVALYDDGTRIPTNVTQFVTTPSIVNCQFFVDYVFLDQAERELFVTKQHSYLIEQVQFSGSDSVDTRTSAQKARLMFNHPVKMLLWVLQRQDNAAQIGSAYNDWFNYSTALPGTPNPDQALDLLQDAKLVLNGTDRFAVRPQTYFRLVQPYQHLERIPAKNIYMYSFALHPIEWQPSGTCNFSRLDTVQLLYNLTQWTTAQRNALGLTDYAQMQMFAVNYNVMTVSNGMAALKYAS
jgi:hypothetical protein